MWVRFLHAGPYNMYTLQSINPTPSMTMSSPESGSDITFNSGPDEMLRITQDGFYVRGVRVPADDKEAVAVYNSFKQWIIWASMQAR